MHHLYQYFCRNICPWRMNLHTMYLYIVHIPGCIMIFRITWITVGRRFSIFHYKLDFITNPVRYKQKVSVPNQRSWMNFEFQWFEYENSVFAFYQEFFVIVMLFYMQINERINIYRNGRCNVVLHLCIDKKFPPFNSENYLIFKTKCEHFIGIVMPFHTNCEY